LAAEAAAKNEAYENYLLRLTEAEVTTRSANALSARIRTSASGAVFQGDRMTAALLDRLTRRCDIFEMNGELLLPRVHEDQERERPQEQEMTLFR